MAVHNKGFGLRGLHLKAAMVILVVMPSFLLFGYNNGSTGGIVGLQSFVKVRHQHADISALANNLLRNFPQLILLTYLAM